MIDVLEGDVWVLTLDRADKANALTAAMLQSLVDAVDRATSTTPAALVLTGRGKVFSAGADLEAVREGLATNPVWEALSSRIAALPFPTIAALNGTVAGGAMGMVLACDMRIAVPSAKFFYPVMKMGVLPQPSDPARLSRLVGPSRASVLLLGGAKVGADEALAWGLIDRIDDDPVAQAHALAEGAIAAAPDHRAAIKAMIKGADS